MPKSTILTSVLTDKLKSKILATKNPEKYLVLEEIPELPGRWIVQALGDEFLTDLVEFISESQTVSPASLEEFSIQATELGYHIVFAEDPAKILDTYVHLNEKPAVSLNSDLPGTEDGFLPFQLQGFNFLKDLDAGIVMWSTGLGKSVVASALLKYHLQMSDFDVAFVVVKAHNKINFQRTLKRLADIDATVLDGPQKRREEILGDVLKSPSGCVIVTNYEKFRIDHDLLLPLFEKRILLILDEAPTKLKSRKTQLYKSFRKLLYRKINLTELRPQHLRQYVLSATPIENGPEDFYNVVRLLDPNLYGLINDFRDKYVKSYDPFGYQPATWKKLDEMGQVASQITHQVDKTDPDISDQFPEVIDEIFYIDWDKGDRAVYNLLAAEAKKKIQDRELFTEQDIFSLIGVMEMLCCAPSMVSNSAALRQDYELGLIPHKKGSEVAARLQELLTRPLDNEKHTKLETLRQLVCEDHPNEKIVIFSSYNQTLLPILEDQLTSWGVEHVRYEGTQQQKQFAQDYFQKDEKVRVFLSSDQGSDSISLEEASVVIHYNLPWKWSTKIQRENRAHRITSTHKHVRYYTLLMEDSVEERKLKILEKKQKYQNQIFKGEIDQGESSRMTREDLCYILFD